MTSGVRDETKARLLSFQMAFVFAPPHQEESSRGYALIYTVCTIHTSLGADSTAECPSRLSLSP
jgi:hypothetical protein